MEVKNTLTVYEFETKHMDNRRVRYNIRISSIIENNFSMPLSMYDLLFQDQRTPELRKQKIFFSKLVLQNT